MDGGNTKCRLHTRKIGKAIWAVLLQVWATSMGIVLPSFQWVLVKGVRDLPFPLYKDMYDYPKYWDASGIVCLLCYYLGYLY